MAKLRDYFTKGIFPYKKQAEAIKFMMAHHYMILNGKPGVGKTLMATAVMALEGGKSICVVPSSLKLNWENEIGKYCDLKVKVFKTGKDLNDSCSYDIGIISYGLLDKGCRIFEGSSTIVFDEAHYLCNIDAARTQRAHEIVEQCAPKRVLLLSGTPIKNRVYEYFSLMAMCAYNPYATSGIDISKLFPTLFKFQLKFSFKQEFRIKGRNIVQFKGVRNIPLLKTLLKDKMITLTLDDVAEIPPLQHIDVLVEYNEGVLQKAWKSFNEGDNKVHISTGKSKAALLKAKYTKDYVNDLLTGVDAVVVFTDHLASADYLHRGIKGSRIITGSISSDKRAELVEGFQKGDIPCLVCTIGAANTGFTLTRASNMVVNDLSWSNSDNEQMVKRIHRIGQTKKSTIHYILGSKIDVKIKKALQSKAKDLQKIV